MKQELMKELNKEIKPDTTFEKKEDLFLKDNTRLYFNITGSWKRC